MVHIPIVGIDVPEPRIAALVPTALDVLITALAKARNGIERRLYPLSDEQQVKEMQEYVDSFPREFEKVFEKSLAGKYANEEQLSSELEEASYTWYRRMMRVNCIGATDEVQEDVTAWKLGLTNPSPQQEVLDAYKAEQERLAAEDYPDPIPEIVPITVDFTGDDIDVYVPKPGIQEMSVERPINAERATINALNTRDRQFQASLKMAEEGYQLRTEHLEKEVLGSSKGLALTSMHAGLGAGLGLLLFRGIGLAWKYAMKSLTKGRKKSLKEKKAMGAVVAARAQRHAAGAAAGAGAAPRRAAATSSAKEVTSKETAAKATKTTASTKASKEKTSSKAETTARSSTRAGTRKR